MAKQSPYLRSGKYINRLRTLFRAVIFFFLEGVGGLLCFVVFFFLLCFVLFFSKKDIEILQKGNRGLETSELS